MIVVDCTNAEGADTAEMGELLNFLGQIYGDLENMWIVSIYSYSDFLDQRIDWKSDARQVVNTDLDNAVRKRISW